MQIADCTQHILAVLVEVMTNDSKLCSHYLGNLLLCVDQQKFIYWKICFLENGYYVLQELFCFFFFCSSRSLSFALMQMFMSTKISLTLVFNEVLVSETHYYQVI